MQRDTGLAQAVAAVLEALFHRDADADELGPGLPHDVAQAAHGLAARKEIVNDEHAVSGMEPLLGDDQGDLFPIGVGDDLTAIQAAFNVVAFCLLGKDEGLVVAVCTDRGFDAGDAVFGFSVEGAA